MPALEYLVQAALRSHQVFCGIAHPADVVTARIVTRRKDGVPTWFSCAIEIPVEADNDGIAYLHLEVDADGTLIRDAVPDWASPDSAQALGSSADAVSSALGMTIPGFDSVVSSALTAMSRCPPYSPSPGTSP